MSMNYPVLAITVQLSAPTEAARFLKPTATPSVFAPAAANTDKAVGVSCKAGAAGERIDVGLIGVFPITFGADVAAGDDVTTDNQGRAIVATGTAKVYGKCLIGGGVGAIGALLLGGAGPQGPQGVPG